MVLRCGSKTSRTKRRRSSGCPLRTWGVRQNVFRPCAQACSSAAGRSNPRGSRSRVDHDPASARIQSISRSSPTPPTRDAKTGNPASKASRTDTGVPSLREGRTTASTKGRNTVGSETVPVNSQRPTNPAEARISQSAARNFSGIGPTIKMRRRDAASRSSPAKRTCERARCASPLTGAPLPTNARRRSPSLRSLQGGGLLPTIGRREARPSNARGTTTHLPATESPRRETMSARRAGESVITISVNLRASPLSSKVQSGAMRPDAAWDREWPWNV